MLAGQQVAFSYDVFRKQLLDNIVTVTFNGSKDGLGCFYVIFHQVHFLCGNNFFPLSIRKLHSK